MKRSYASCVKVFTPATRPRRFARRSSARRIMTWSFTIFALFPDSHVASLSSMRDLSSWSRQSARISSAILWWSCAKKTLANRQSETSDLRKQVASALDEERKRVAKRAKELASVEGELAKLATKEQADVATLRGRLEGLSKRLAAANADAKRKKEAYEAAAATASKLEQEKKELHEHLAMMVLSSEQRKEDKLKELLAAMGATDVS